MPSFDGFTRESDQRPLRRRATIRARISRREAKEHAGRAGVRPAPIESRQSPAFPHCRTWKADVMNPRGPAAQTLTSRTTSPWGTSTLGRRPTAATDHQTDQFATIDFTHRASPDERPSRRHGHSVGDLGKSSSRCEI